MECACAVGKITALGKRCQGRHPDLQQMRIERHGKQSALPPLSGGGFADNHDCGSVQMIADFASLAENIVLHTQRRLPSPAAARWTTQELETLRAGLGYMSEEEIAQRLPRRSVVA